MVSPTTQMKFEKTDWRSIYVASFVAFCAAVQFGLYFSSIWPYLQTIDDEATEQFLGVIIAAYSLATCVASPIFGYWSNRIKQIRVPMYTGIASMVLGNVIYLCAELLPSHRRYSFLAARFFTGIGSANIPLLRAYASTSCNPKDRPRAMSFVTGGISLGILVGPAIQILFTPLSYPGLVLFHNFRVNMYTASAYGACTMNIVSYLCLRFLFVENYSGIHSERKEPTENEEQPVKIPKFDPAAAAICNYTKFAQQLVFINAEIIGSPLAMSVFGFTKQQTIQYNSIAQSGVGVAGLIVLVAFIGFDLNKHVKYRIGVIVAVCFHLAYLLLTYPWPFLSDRIPLHTDIDLSNATEEVVGCNIDHLLWCATTPRVSPWVFYIAFMVFVGLAYPVTDICLNTVYGRILGPRRQGTMQGVMQVSNGAAQNCGPATELQVKVCFTMPDESEGDYAETDWRSIYVASFVAFCIAAQYSLYFTSMWPYLKTIDEHVTEQFFGLVVAVYSLSSCIASPIFGYWSNRIKQIRLPLNVGIAFMTVGDIIYFSSELVPSERRYVLFAARLITGVGSANLPLLRAYASTACNPKDRPRSTALITGGICFGILVGPAFQLLCTPLSYPGLVIFRHFSINMYTASAYGSCIMNIISFTCLKCLFVEKIGAPYAMTIFAYTKQKALQTNSIAQSIFGIIALIVFAVFIGFKLDKHVKYRIGTIITFIVILAFLLITFPWPFLTERIVMFSGSDAVNSTKEMTGCDTDTLKWCAKTKAVNPWVYYVSYTITMGFGFPVMDICLNTVYGRVLGPRRQGTMQGLLRVSGSIARMVGPLVVSVLFASYGPTVVWIAQLAVVAVVMLMWIVFYRRMVALKIVAVDRKISALSSTLTRADTVFPDVPKP
ncbi:hypothetical protein QR680_010063 [Steinernema hermaphroditum]|uniref:Major facilitator superfamily (MFS) profile domain-containing protein n=1 Tax=Steinernema hermaphroditum TaxID=289476 RepID=A0AA39IMK9_9BILA|nr:hypothetical protein QR680_010063 [Steinernema hermaphroditum]